VTIPECADVAVVGGGPAGLTAAIESGRAGCRTVVLDAGITPGGQLTKQIHKFFGSRTQGAGRRGLDIAADLAEEAEANGAVIRTDSTVQAADQSGRLEVLNGARSHGGSPEKMQLEHIRAKRVVLATGAEENAIAFSGWTRPGVMGAGAVQTMVNIHRVLPGRKVLMVGAGNVGLIVTYQLLQAGANVRCVVEAACDIGGYGVHAAKVRRSGVPILTSHTVQEAHGDSRGVRAATLVQLDEKWEPVPGTEKTIDVDLICIAAGLRPNIQLSSIMGCRLVHSTDLGGWLPVHDCSLMTTRSSVYVAGDASGVEEATAAMEEGRLAGVSAAESLGRLNEVRASGRRRRIQKRLAQLRGGPLGESIRGAKHQIQRGQSI